MSLRGAEALQQKKYGDAESLFSEAIRQSPADERAQSGYAEVLLQKGQVQAATEHMTKAVETSGGNPDLVVRLGQMHLEQGELSLAIEQANLALRDQRTHAGAWALKGDVLRQQRQLQEALDCYHRSLIYHSDAPQVQIALAEIYHQLGRPQRALATLNNLADHHSPEQIPPRAWLLKGQALADLGEDMEAKRCLRLATQYAGESQSGLLLELASAQYSCGDLAEARLCLGRVLRQEPSNPSALQLQSQLDQSFVQMASDQNGKVPAMNANFQREHQ
jgi:predicted Zn-dependent protease